ncbi:MAG: GmrSD restriction endonuclease domain-containing protein [Planctomycetota bacterium]|jgi:hypothetical protein
MDMRSEKRALDKIYKRRDRYEIPDWQREKVWPRLKKQALIDSILKNWKIPKFYFVKTSCDPNEYEVVDGQQRLLAIFEFFDNELPLRQDTAREAGASYYKDLPEAVQDGFDDYEIEFDEITNAGDEELKEFFQRLQEGLPLTSSEKLNSLHGRLRDFCRSLSKHDFFKKKVLASDKRYGHFDIVAKVAVIEIEGVDVGLRFDDLRTAFNSQKSFSSRSNVAKHLRETFDYLNKVFPKPSPTLKNRSIVQSFATLTAVILQTGNSKGTETRLRKFFEFFSTELSRQVTLGQQATDPEYLAFQKTVNANVRRSAQIRNEILLRKLLTFDPSLADIFGVSLVTQSGIDKAIGDVGDRIRNLVEQINDDYSRANGIDLFKPTNKTTNALAEIGKRAKDYAEYVRWIDKMYFIFRESLGTRLGSKWPASFADVNALRTAEQHDVDHGKKRKITATRKKLGATFKKYAGSLTPATLAPEKFAVLQASLLSEIERDLRGLKY